MAEKLCELKKKGSGQNKIPTCVFTQCYGSQNSLPYYTVVLTDLVNSNSFNNISFANIKNSNMSYSFENAYLKYTRSNNHSLSITLKKDCIVGMSAYNGNDYSPFQKHVAGDVISTTQAYLNNPQIFFYD